MNFQIEENKQSLNLVVEEINRLQETVLNQKGKIFMEAKQRTNYEQQYLILLKENMDNNLK